VAETFVELLIRIGLDPEIEEVDDLGVCKVRRYVDEGLDKELGFTTGRSDEYPRTPPDPGERGPRIGKPFFICVVPVENHVTRVFALPQAKSCILSGMAHDTGEKSSPSRRPTSLSYNPCSLEDRQIDSFR